MAACASFPSNIHKPTYWKDWFSSKSLMEFYLSSHIFVISDLGSHTINMVWEEVIALLLRSWCILYRQENSRWRGWTAFTRRLFMGAPKKHRGCTLRRLCPPHFHQCAWYTTERFLYGGGWIKPSECEWKMEFIFTQVSWSRSKNDLKPRKKDDFWLKKNPSLSIKKMKKKHGTTVLEEPPASLVAESLRTQKTLENPWARHPI